MIRLIQFLNEKNHFLEKFYSLNEKQIALLESGQFDEIEKFYNQREDLLKILKYIDSETHQAHMDHKEMTGTFNEAQKSEIREALRVKEMYVRKILEQDLVVISLIDEAKNQIIKELQSVQKARRALTGYKSSEA
jgi:hypothetical protein